MAGPRTLGLQERIGREPAGRGMLRDDRSRFLGLTIKRFPDLDPVPHAEIGARVAAALTGADASPDAPTRLLADLRTSSRPSSSAATAAPPPVGRRSSCGTARSATRWPRPSRRRSWRSRCRW